MSTNGDSLAERVQSSYLELALVASDLNAISDELGKSISEIDLALKKLNLGVSVWVNIRAGGDDLDYFMEQIGYSKVDGKWGVALRTVSGNHSRPDEDTIEQWLFSDAPRRLRVAAIDKLPEMLKSLSNEAAETARKITAKLAEAKEVAAAVKGAAEAPKREGPVSALDQMGKLRKAVLRALVDANQRIMASMLEGGEWTLQGDELVIGVAESQTIVDMSFSPDGRRLAIAAASGTLGRAVRVNIVPDAKGLSARKQKK